MSIFTAFIIGISKGVSWISRLMRLGSGATWPGEVALRIHPLILSELVGNLKKGVILVAGTNGKTTTALMITTILEAQGLKVIHNASGANLLNGVVSSLINNANWQGKTEADYGVFEVDENSLPVVLGSCHSGLRARIHHFEAGSRVKPGMTKSIIIVLLNLFRDQLDRYGEVDVIAQKWGKALLRLDTGNQTIKQYQIIANADDPLIAHLGIHASFPVSYFGINDTSKYLPHMEHAADSIFCLNCSARLQYEGVYFSHIGIWKCSTCGEKRPKPDVSSATSPLPGLYNMYNTLAVSAVAHVLGIAPNLAGFRPAFGRQEKIGDITIFLSKNPAGFNESLRTVLELNAKNILFALNDRIPDGKDVSWIWDVDFEMLPKGMNIFVTGDRALDMAVRLKYVEHSVNIVSEIPHVPNLFILATYSAMLEIRKQLIGKKIL